MSGTPNAKRLLNEETKEGASAVLRWANVLEDWMKEPAFLRLPEKKQADALLPFMAADKDLLEPLEKWKRAYMAELKRLNQIL